MSSKLNNIGRAVLVLALAPIVGLSAAGGPRVLTNKAAYVAGERVLVPGHGFLPFEVVTLQVGSAGKAVGPFWSTIADGHGRIESVWPATVDAVTGTDLVVTAIAGSSRAQTASEFHRTAVLVTDKTSIKGSSFAPRENVTLHLAPAGQSWFVTTDDEGTFTSDFDLDREGSAATATELNASGEWSGLSASALIVAGGFDIDGAIPDGTALQFGDPYGSASELGPLNNTNTKLLAINGAGAPMLSFTNPNAQVDLRTIWMATNVFAGDAWLYFAWERDSNSGSGVIAFEFQQSPRPPSCDYSKTDQVDSPP